jgi:transposase
MRERCCARAQASSLTRGRASVKESRIRELQGCVTGVLPDKAAVVAGLTLSYSNGVVEGKVNKLMKRMGYGRASFPLTLVNGCSILSRAC